MKLSSFTQICCDLRALSESFCAQNLATRKVFAFSDSDDLPATHTPLSILNPRTLHFFEPVSSFVFLDRTTFISGHSFHIIQDLNQIPEYEGYFQFDGSTCWWFQFTLHIAHCSAVFLCYLGREIFCDDHHRNPNINYRDHLVGQLTTLHTSEK